jgi:predicted nucleic acid-binding protein
MIVVADSSPFIGLLKIDCIDILPRLYGSVLIPTRVAAELSDGRRPAIVKQFIARPPSWLSVRSPQSIEIIPGLDEGELAAISLAREVNADVLLIDDADGRRAAMARNIQTLRTTALLLDAAKAGVLNDLKGTFGKLKATNFRVSQATLEELMLEFEAFQRNRDP